MNERAASIERLLIGLGFAVACILRPRPLDAIIAALSQSSAAVAGLVVGVLGWLVVILLVEPTAALFGWRSCRAGSRYATTARLSLASLVFLSPVLAWLPPFPGVLGVVCASSVFGSWLAGKDTAKARALDSSVNAEGLRPRQ